MYYYGFRFYEPTLQRWMNEDPIGLAGGINLYRLVGNNPINYIDLVGLDPAFSPGIGIFSGLSASQEMGASAGAAPFLGMTAATMVPGVGEAMDASVLSDQDAAWWEKALAAGSLLANAVSEGFLPNAGPFLKTCKKWGSKGKPDHQKKVADLVEKLEKEAQSGEQVLREKKIQGYDSNRRPDAQLVDESGKTKQVQEAERYPNRQRNRDREAEYQKLGIPNETNPLE